MENKYNESTTLRPEGDRVIDAPVVAVDLPGFIEQIKNEKSWDKNDRNAITVFKTDVMRVVLVALHKDAEMVRHSTQAMLSLQVLEGEIVFKTDERSFELEKGQMLAVHEGVAHSVVATEDAIFLLTLSNDVSGK